MTADCIAKAPSQGKEGTPVLRSSEAEAPQASTENLIYQ